MTRTRSALRGFATDLGGNGLLILTNFAAAPIILGHVSPGQYGFWLSALSMLAFLGLVEFGIGIALSRRVAEIAHTEDREAISRVVTTACVVLTVAAALLMVVGLILIAFAPGWFHLDGENTDGLIRAGQIAIVASALALPLAPYGAVAVGYQRLATHNIIVNAVTILGILAGLGLLWAGLGIVALAIGHAITLALVNFLNIIVAKRICPWRLLRLSALDRAELKTLVTFGGYFQIGRIANTVALNADNLVISSFLGAALVTPYTFTARLATLVSVTLASKLPVATFPGATEAFSMGQLEQLRRVTIRLFGYATRLMLLGVVVVALINEQFVTLWVGAEQYGGAWLTAAFVSWVAIDTIYRGTMGIIFASGKIKHWAVCSGIEAMLNIVLSIALIGPFGLVGVAVGTTLAKLLTSGWYGPVLISQALELPLREMIVSGVIEPATRSLPGIAIVLCVFWVGSDLYGWLWIISISGLAFVTNVLAFEGTRFLSARGVPWRDRLQELVG